MALFRHFYKILRTFSRKKHRVTLEGKIHEIGKTAIVTGACSGIGLQCIKTLLENGVKNLSIADINVERGLCIMDEVRWPRGSCLQFVECDVSKKSHVNHLFHASNRQFGNVDIVINNAGKNDK